MHRFRKKSDAKRSQVPNFLRPQTSESHEYLPELPPASDFRTSLILPDLSRRFTLLRTSSGDPVSLDDLRNRFAEQRARGAENQISEEEEDMILETLGRMRAKNTTTPDRSEEDIAEADYSPSVGRQSVQSTNTLASSSFSPSVTSSPSGRSTKRYSNNLFGSGRFRDYTYMRSVSSNKNGSARSAPSIIPTESSLSLRENTSSYSDSLRPATPEGSAPSSSVQSSPNEKISVRSAPLIPPAPYGEQSLSAAEYRLSKTLGPSVFKRASLALEEAIKEIEEEVEDEIVMPRSAPILRTATVDQQHNSADMESDFVQLSPFEAGMAISSDKQVRTEPEARRVSPVPSRILPGYIPGMPRPMTPRDSLDSDDQRSHSTTPRATSPILPGLREFSPSPVIPLSLASGLLRRESNSSPSRQSPRPISPMFLQRSPSGRHTPEDTQRGAENFASEFENSVNSSVLGRRRPVSPLSAPAYQPMAVSSRPGTPSNVTWTTPLNSRSQNASGHSRNGSWVSDVGVNSPDVHELLEHSSSTRSLRSPAPPDAPLTDRGHANTSSFSSNSSNGLSLAENRPSPSISGVDLGSPILAANRALRSPTPTQTASCSPTSPAFSNFDLASRNGSRRSSKQNAPSSPFSQSLFHPLVFSPIANSSRSSLESAGSSYHSWDGEQHKDRIHSLFSDVDPQQPAWHDISYTDKSSSATPGGSQDDGWDAEDIIGRYAGLTRPDFLAIQEKLVGVAIAKTATPDIGNRAPSLRRRRPSTSQSNYSFNGRDTRIASPLPQTQPPSSPTFATPHSDQYSALLNSVVDSIQSPKAQSTETGAPPMFQTENNVSPTARRNRDLAQVLFGLQDGDDKESPSRLSPSVPSEVPTVVPEQSPSAGNSSFRNPASSNMPTDGPRSASSATQLPRNPSTPKSPAEAADLAKDVQRKTDAAMIALRKHSSNTNLIEGISPGGSISRKRISPHQISTPRLVSASTSVDTIPLRSPSVASGQHPTPSKIASRFKMLRGTLRGKAPAPTGEEVTPYPLDLHSPPPSQIVHYDPAKLSVPAGPGATSATELGRFKVSVPSPPASAGPGLKGFMARFRSRQRTAGISPDSDRRRSPQSPATSFVTPSQPSERAGTQQYSSPNSNSDTVLTPTPRPLPPFHPSALGPGTLQEDLGTNDESLALKQFLDAASNLGLDPGALNDLLARSGSTSSRSADWLTRINSPSTSSRPETRDGMLGDGVPSATPSSGRPLAEGQAMRNENVTRKLSVRKQVDHIRRPRDDQGDNASVNAVVRRTVIFPSESRSSTIDLNVLMRKTSSRRRRVSAASISSRSVHDRAPTPPPPRSPTTRRFSTDASPPVPQLPPSFSAQAENLLNIPQPAHAGGPIEKSSSTYDSLYEMYAGESKAASSPANDINSPDNLQPLQSDVLPNSESRPALEVIELANGETIWSIVNGLRDDDAESVYTSRTSFASEYSAHETNGDGVQVFVKELGRTNSKSSNSSLLPRKKPLQGKPRPETKVFYSSSAQIGRLIENLSQGMESGSFNFLPNHRPGHSTSSSLAESDMHWTVEERLEHMLGSMGTN